MKSINLFNDTSFSLERDESITQITPELRARFQSYFDAYSFQVPLFKCAKSPEYTVFIGLPLNLNLNDLITGQNTDFSSVQNTDSLTYLYKSRQIDNDYVSEYTINCNGNHILILAETSNKTIADSLFNYQKLSQRLTSCN